MPHPLSAGRHFCLAATLAATVLWIGCTSKTEGSDAGVEYDGPFSIAVEPPINAVDVFTDKVIRVTFSGHLDSRTFTQSRFNLHSGPIALWTMAFYDPIHRQLVLWPSMGMRKYATWILETVEGVKGLDGELVAPGEVARFRTGEREGDNMPFVTPSFESDILPIFQKHCATCHGGEPGDELAGVRLDSQDAITQTLINARAGGWPGWSRIVPARPGQSYLLYKVIGDPRIAGAPMPRNFNSGEEASTLPLEQQELLRDWIASGTPFVDTDFESHLRSDHRSEF